MRGCHWVSLATVKSMVLIQDGSSELVARIWRLFRCNQMPSSNRNSWFTPYVRIVKWATISYKNHGLNGPVWLFERRNYVVWEFVIMPNTGAGGYKFTKIHTSSLYSSKITVLPYINIIQDKHLFFNMPKCYNLHSNVAV